MIIEIILLIIFIILFIFGFYIIYRQVALIKKGEFNFKDRFQCIFYGFIFSLAVTVVIAVAFIFAAQFWEITTIVVNPLVLLLPFILCLIYITIYPLIDFLFIAFSKESDEGLTPFHKFINKNLIQRFEKKVIAVLIAILFYILIFFVPPILLTLIGIPFIIIWITWMLIYPLIILTFYGSKGYIAGISNAYYHIPYISRSAFINFENPKRGMKQFISDPFPYIILGVMLFVFVWAWISLFQTIGLFFRIKPAISTMSSTFVFVTLFMGIIGYFTRFWGRKVKYRGIDIYFAAYLMASIGINVLVNFQIVNPENLKDTFNLWSLTSEINTNFRMLSWAAAIEEIVLIIFTSYFFLARNNEFKKNIRYSKISECSQSFDAIPLFNFIKNKDPEIRRHAEESLRMMFERIPLKSEIDLNNWKFKNSILDGISDTDPNSRRICYQILTQLEKDVPEITLPWILESLASPNYNKNVPILKSIINRDDSFINRIPENVVLNLLIDPEWRLKLLGLRLFSKLLDKNKDLITKIDTNKLINDPNSKIQAEILNIYSDNSLKLPENIILEKISHKSNEIRAAAIKNLINLSEEGFSEKLVLKIIPMIKDSSSSVRASIFKVLTLVGKFKKNKITDLPLLEGLVDFDERVRNSAINALVRYYEEQPKALDLDGIISRIDPNNIMALNSILVLIGRLWKHNPEKILKTLLMFIKFDNDQLKANISNILIEKYDDNPNLIIQNLILIPDTTGFITKGVIAKTFIQIGKKDSINLIRKLFGFLTHENEDVKLNSINSLDGLIDEFPSSINIKPILDLLLKDENKQIQKEASRLISKVAKKDSSYVKPFINELIQALTSQESSVRIVLIKSLLEIASASPEIIPVQNMFNFLSDPDSFIRETNIKILGLIGYKNPSAIVDVLINRALIDEEWSVREAAVSSLGNIVPYIENKEYIIKKLVSLLDGEQSWVRRSALIILSKIEEVNESNVPFNTFIKCLTSSDSKVREASASLLFIYSSNINEIFNEIIPVLGDKVIEVRENVINSIVKIIHKIGLDQILSNLLKNLSDEGSIEVQQSIALILGRTALYENETIKKRAIALLKIRCEMSQDPIICNVLQKLKEG
ncbi:MAG: HEAT repeat domain-containing protein [Promethearchaeota archaeon]